VIPFQLTLNDASGHDPSNNPGGRRLKLCEEFSARNHKSRVNASDLQLSMRIRLTSSIGIDLKLRKRKRLGNPGTQETKPLDLC
jgi:hypothetical protein